MSKRGLIKYRLDADEFWLTEEEVRLVEEQDAVTPLTYEGDIAFNKWFRQFCKDRKITAVNKRMSRYWTGANFSTDPVVKLATALRAARTIVRSIDRENRLDVKYADSATSWWADNEVYLPTAPVKDTDDLYEAINIEGGFSIHEACHSKHTRPHSSPAVHSYMSQSPVQATLANLIEDIRIEEIELQDSPGYATYLRQTCDYMWDKAERTFPEWDDELTVDQKLGGLITGLRYDYKGKVLPESWDGLLEEARKIVGDHVANPKIIDNAERLKKMLVISPEDEQKEEERQSGLAPGEGAEEGRNLLPCQFVRGEKAMSGETRKKIEGLVEQEVESEDPLDSKWDTPDSMRAPRSITVIRPKGVGLGAPARIDGLLAKAKAALEFRKAIPRADERLMTSGELDEDELYRLLQRDTRVFRDITEEVIPEAAVYLLVDMSGSMNGSMSYEDYSLGARIDVAERFAHLLVASMKSKPNVKVRVLGHTGDTTDATSHGSFSEGDFRHGDALFLRIWEEGDSLNRLSLITRSEHGENYDSYAIKWAGDLLAKEEADQKLLIVLSDGEPAGRGYGGDSAEHHVRHHVDALARKGIDTIQISIAVDLSEHTQDRMFKHYVPAKGTGQEIYHNTIRVLQRLLTKLSQPR